MAAARKHIAYEDFIANASAIFDDAGSASFMLYCLADREATKERTSGRSAGPSWASGGEYRRDARVMMRTTPARATAW